MTPRNKSVVSLLVLFILTGGAAPAQADGTSRRDLFAAASEQAIFLARVEKTDTGSDRTAILSRRLGGGVRWRRLAVADRRIISLSARGDDAIALFDDGDWATIWDGGSPLGPQLSGARLVALAADRSLDRYVLWAVAIPSAPTTRSATAASLSTSSATTPATVPAGPALYKFESNRWSRVVALPAEAAGADVSKLSLTVIGSTPVLASATRPNRLRSWSLKAADWSIPADVLTAGPIYNFRLIEAGVPPTLWLTIGGPGILTNPGAAAERPLAGDGAADEAPRSATLAAETLRVYSISENKLYEQAYKSDGSPLGARSKIIAEIPSEEAPWQSWLAPAMTTAFTLIVISAVRRTPVVNPQVLESAGVALAPLGVRFVAGVIDASPVLASIAWAVYGESRLESINELPPTRLVLPFYISLVLYLVYVTTAEIFRGQTLGKWFFGLRIVNIQGLAPDPGTIIMRNLLRLVDLMMMFVPLALIFFSPLRQRLGDIAAGTLVVMKATAADSAHAGE